jgi:cytochrome c
MPSMPVSAAQPRKTARATLILAAALALPASLAAGEEAQPLSPAAQRGLVFVRTHCAQCHSVDRVSASPLRMAPPFRTLHERYPVENLQESLAEGIITGHPSMPEFRLDPGQVADVIAYLKTLEQ